MVVKGGQPGTALAKTTRPTIESAVARESLFARLDEPAGRTIAWISGAPGSGKTTLAASYVQARRLKYVWYEVDADDADPATFFHYLTHAARKLGAAHARALPSFAAPHARDVAAFSRRYFRALFASDPEPLVLILDNVQAVPEGGGLHAVLEAGLAEVPKGCCVVVTSRSEPPAMLARLRASGKMSCVAGRELSLTPDEIVAIARLRGQLVSPASAEQLHERTQGWAAGLVLLLEHSRFSGRIVELPGDPAPQVVFDYLGGEIFERFDRGTREFLLRIACLPRITAPVAGALTGEPKAERLLVNFAQNDYFVREAASDAGRIYQMHPLFRAFLRRRAAETLPDAAGSEWLRRAAALLRGAGHTEDAIPLLVEAGDWEEIAGIAVDETDAMLAQGRSETLASWLDLLPMQLVESDPRLLFASAAARAEASPRAARRLFERACELFRARSDAAGTLRSCCGVVDAIVDELDDLAPLDGWLDALDSLLADAWTVSPTGCIGAVTTLIGATLLREPGHPRVEAWLARAEGIASDATGALPPEARAALAYVRALAALARADLTAAEAALGLLRANDAQAAPATAASCAVPEGLLCLLRGDGAEATCVTKAALALAESEGTGAGKPWLQAILVAAKLGGGERSDGRAALASLESDVAGLQRGGRACLHYLRGWAAALQGDAGHALRESKLAVALAVEVGIPWLECVARLALARCLAGGAELHGVAAQLRAAEAIATRSKSAWLGYATQLTASAAAMASADRAVALENLRVAFRQGYEHGFRAPPGWEPRALAQLCAVALDADIEPEFARVLVREGKLVPETPPLRVRRWPWRLHIRSCGGFECLREEAPIELSAKGPGRPMELLKVLVALGMHNVRADQLADALWPNVEADYAYKSFSATLHRLRRMLGEDALMLRDGRLSLDKGLVWIDAWALEQLFDDFDATLRGADACGDGTLRREYSDQALALYRGPFLPDESEQPAYIACRERLRARLLRFLSRIARGWEEADAPEIAADCLLRFVDADELCEPLYRQLMLCYQRTGAWVEAVAVYERLRTILSARQKLMPSPETQALYASLKAAGSTAA